MSKVSKSIRTRIWEKTEGRCWYCGLATIRGSDCREGFTVDHIVPVIAGGGNELPNLRPCCRGCNIAKKNQSVEQFRVYLIRRKHGIPTFTNSQVAYLVGLGVHLPRIDRTLHWFWGEENVTPADAVREAVPA